MEGVERDAGAPPQIPDLKDGIAPPVFGTDEGGGSSRLDSGSISTVPDALDTGPAMRGQPNAFAWRPITQAEMLAYRESYSDLGTIAANGLATLDPNESTNFVIRAAGAMSIAIGPAAVPPNLDPSAPTPQFLLGLKVWVYRPKGSVVTWSSVKWSKTVTDPAGDGSKPSLLAAAAADGWDSYTLVVFPFATFGYLAGPAYPA
ncbi:hypothetical protein [Methylobacterium sp. Leaf112]|uniref:hypothetical protein n=1 Tax=Methylobacterium sp. Leaf112 TaxID=1736258 RepID=UPI0006F24391|nr:hypothetical protein [Methylobacterium sp. Leaf112]KQP62146.1 hypothetical protein ASF52_05670 [Methylobacterium sp. Leaf112]